MLGYHKMLSLKTLLNMVATEGIEGGPTDHYFDEWRNREFIPLEPERGAYPRRDLPTIRFGLELIQMPDGSLDWVDDYHPSEERT